MKHSSIGLTLLAFLFTTAFSAPLDKDGAIAYHHPSSPHGRLSMHRRLSRRTWGTAIPSTERPLNLSFTPVGESISDMVQVEYGASELHATSDSTFSATLSKLSRSDDTGFGSSDAQTTVYAPDAYGGRHVAISISDTLIWALQQKGISQDDVPQYVRQNIRFTDPSTGNQYQLVPDTDLVSSDSNAITIALKLN